MQTGATVEVGVDYWEWTCPYERGWDLLSVFPGGYEVRRNEKGKLRGWRGYTHSAELAQGKGLVGWSPEDRRMGVHFSLGSEALSVVAALDSEWADLPSVIEGVLDELEGHTTRIDLRWDDTSGVLSMDDVGQALRAGDYVSRWRKWKYWESEEGTKDFGLVRGESYYLGSGKSDSQLRIYDKRAERMQNGHAVEADHWLRVELQLRRKRSDAASRLFSRITKAGDEVRVKLAGYLRSMVEFKTPNPHDSNKRRWPAAGWWLRFLGYAEKARLAVVKAEARTMEEVRSWVSSQVAPTLALLEEGMGFDEAWAFLYAEAQQARARLGPRHRSILAASGVT